VVQLKAIEIALNSAKSCNLSDNMVLLFANGVVWYQLCVVYCCEVAVHVENNMDSKVKIPVKSLGVITLLFSHP